MWRFINVLCGVAAFFFALHGTIDTPPCACQVLSIDPSARWRVEDVRTPYSDGSAGYLEGRDSGYLAVMMYTCEHGVRLTINMDADTEVCWGSITSRPSSPSSVPNAEFVLTPVTPNEQLYLIDVW